jgi:hypothetical protein
MVSQLIRLLPSNSVRNFDLEEISRLQILGINSTSNHILNSLPDAVHIVAHNLGFLLAILEDLCRWNALDTILSRAAATLINIDRCEDNVRVSSVLTCELFKLRSQGNTRATPSRSELNHYDLVA